jgi:hypothetical protein
MPHLPVLRTSERSVARTRTVRNPPIVRFDSPTPITNNPMATTNSSVVICPWWHHMDGPPLVLNDSHYPPKIIFLKLATFRLKQINTGRPSANYSRTVQVGVRTVFNYALDGPWFKWMKQQTPLWFLIIVLRMVRYWGRTVHAWQFQNLSLWLFVNFEVSSPSWFGYSWGCSYDLYKRI